MSYCGQASLLADGPQEKCAVTLRCHTWDCEHCGPGRLKRLYAEVVGGEPNAMLTLTTRQVEGETPTDEAKRQSVWMHELMRRIQKRTCQRDLNYAVVREAHQSKWPHLHIAWRGPWIDVTWLREQWREITTGSFMVDIRRIDQGRIAGYVANYLKKAPARFGTCRRAWKTTHYDKRVKPDDKPRIDFGAPWQKRNECILTFAENWTMQGLTVKFIGYDEVRAEQPP